MSALDDPRTDQTCVLTKDELHLLRFTCDLYAEEESPLGPLQPLEDAGVLESAARTLAARNLLDARTYRPHRELVRRLLIVAQPDARTVLLVSSPSGRNRVLDVYERAGAYVSYERQGDDHHLGQPRELEELIADVITRFRPRRSGGDFVDFTLDATEYFVFSVLAGDLARQQEGSSVSVSVREDSRTRTPTPTTDPGRQRVVIGEGPTIKNMQLSSVGLSVPVSGESFADEGTPIHSLLRKLPKERTASVPGKKGKLLKTPSDQDWQRALSSLAKKDIVSRIGDRFLLRPYLHDLAVGLATRRRIVLTRFDFGAEDWLVRDATFVDVQGSLFLVRAAREAGAIQIWELDGRQLENTVRYTIEPIGNRETIEFG